MTGASSHSTISYRADIQGLRACAVAAVVVFHALPQWLPGGFLGVDVFFVVSGYLITAILTRELADGTFSLIDFYRRRIIRILPALSVMIVVTGVLGCLVLLPTELQYLGRSMAAAMVFANNIVFYRHLDYFGGSAEFDPLLHTWSLGVEEQFYIFYPLALMVLFRVSRTAVPVGIALISGISLLLALWLRAAHPTFVFYMLPTRAWEIGSGALVATLRSGSLRPRVREPLALAALAAIIMPMVIFANDSSPYPSCVIAVLGAATLLQCGSDTIVGKALDRRPLVALGAISYSLYLWHWPVLAFYRTLNGIALTYIEAFALIGLALILAMLSWYAIERPLMTRRRSLSARIVFAVGALVTLLLGAFGLTLYLTSPAIGRLPRRIEAIANVARYRETATYRRTVPPCDIHVTQNPARDSCLRLDPARPDVLVLGDSFSGHIWLPIALRNPGVHVMTSDVSGCRPLVGAGGKKPCRAQFAYVMRNLIKPGGVDTVVLAARWQEDELRYLARTIHAMQAHGMRVVVMGPVVEYDGRVPALLARAFLAGDTQMLLARRKLEKERLDRHVERIVKVAGASYFSLYRAECPASGCRITTRSGLPLHFDWGHLTFEGAMELTEGMPRIVPTPSSSRIRPGL